jgi:predicted Zn finger-like uncharacterized protein
MIRFACPSCQSAFSVADDKAGLKTKCPQCGQRVEVPNPRNVTMAGGLLPPESPPVPSPAVAPTSPPAELQEMIRQPERPALPAGRWPCRAMAVCDAPANISP